MSFGLRLSRLVKNMFKSEKARKVDLMKEQLLNVPKPKPKRQVFGLKSKGLIPWYSMSHDDMSTLYAFLICLIPMYAVFENCFWSVYYDFKLRKEKKKYIKELDERERLAELISAKKKNLNVD
uniref:Uncharacterized protein n=1 Tax=Tetranychus urticae TaxID=32264 RepID=T1KVT4_TETUR